MLCWLLNYGGLFAVSYNNPPSDGSITPPCDWHEHHHHHPALKPPTNCDMPPSSGYNNPTPPPSTGYNTEPPSNGGGGGYQPSSGPVGSGEAPSSGPVGSGEAPSSGPIGSGEAPSPVENDNPSTTPPSGYHYYPPPSTTTPPANEPPAVSYKNPPSDEHGHHHHPAPKPPTNCDMPPPSGYNNPTPPPSTGYNTEPPSNGGGGGDQPSSGPVGSGEAPSPVENDNPSTTPPSGYHYYPPPSTTTPPAYTPPATGDTSPTPSSDPHKLIFGGTSDFWKRHHPLMFGLLKWWHATIGKGDNTPASNMNFEEALSNTRNDGIGALYREGTASLLNSMVNKNFPFTTREVWNSFSVALRSNKDATAQAEVFKLANEGRLKPRD
ncbi:putative protodermal factor 1 [Helianthus annuus]|nr:putative protodermal factor 1 [Helianthus annuus]